MTKRLRLGAFLMAVVVALYVVTRPVPRESREPVAVGSSSAVAEEPASGTTVSAASAAPKEQSVSQLQADTGVGSSGGGRPAENPQGASMAANPAVATGTVGTPSPVEEVTSPAEELDNVQFMVRGFRDVLGENPFGNNAEITRALMGENARQVRMPVPVGSHLNENGELVDRWGTPYFFHQISAVEMEIRSAGADQKMWTGDDLVTR